MPWALLTVPFRRLLLISSRRSGRGSQVHSLAAPAPGSHLFRLSGASPSRATSPVLRLYVRLSQESSRGHYACQPILPVTQLAPGPSSPETGPNSWRLKMERTSVEQSYAPKASFPVLISPLCAALGLQ